MKKKDFKIPQTLKICNGYRVYPKVITDTQLSAQQNYLLSNESYIRPEYTYPVLQRPKPEPIVPKFVEYDKQCLTYLATFAPNVTFHSEELNTRKQVKILYFLEDDTIAVMEGRQRVVRRGQHKKNVLSNDYYHWKDLNIGREIVLHGLTFLIVHCDQFTKNFMTSKGIQFQLDDQHFELYAPKVTIPNEPTLNSYLERHVNMFRPNQPDQVLR